MEQISKSPEETAKIAQELGKQLAGGDVIYLIGDLGSGKTTFTKALLSTLGVAGTEVKSPTYAYIRRYKTAEYNIFHIDLYRLQEVDELLEMEIEELQKTPNNIVIIEWANRLSEESIVATKNLHFRYIGENKRGIELST
jgi:tRNA threonylcarbamoyladenosine biosynthesis protein TsaE